MTVVNRSLVEQFYDAVGGDVVDTLSGDRMVALSELLEGRVTEDFDCLMVGPDRGERHPGLAGFGAAWRDWVSPYESFSIDIEEIREAGDALLMLVRQRGVTRHGGVAIENASGSVWRFREGLLRRVEFYLDRDAARAAVGVAPRG